MARAKQTNRLTSRTTVSQMRGSCLHSALSFLLVISFSCLLPSLAFTASCITAWTQRRRGWRKRIASLTSTLGRARALRSPCAFRADGFARWSLRPLQFGAAVIICDGAAHLSANKGCSWLVCHYRWRLVHLGVVAQWRRGSLVCIPWRERM